MVVEVHCSTHHSRVRDVFRIEVLDEHVQGALPLPGERGRFERRLLAVDQLHQQELPEELGVLKHRRTGEARPEQRDRLVRENRKAIVAARVQVHDRENVCGAFKEAYVVCGS